MPGKKIWLTVLLATAGIMAATQDQPTPYDLIRPVWPLTWDSTVFDHFVPDPIPRNPIPKNRTPAAYAPNELIPDTLNQAFRDAQNLRIGRIRINQAGYLPDDPEKQFYYVSAGACGEKFSVVDLDGKTVFDGGTFMPSGQLTKSSWDIKAGTDAATNNQGRYTARATGPTGEICIGNLAQATGLHADTRYRVPDLQQDGRRGKASG